MFKNCFLVMFLLFIGCSEQEPPPSEHDGSKTYLGLGEYTVWFPDSLSKERIKTIAHHFGGARVEESSYSVTIKRDKILPMLPYLECVKPGARTRVKLYFNNGTLPENDLFQDVEITTPDGAWVTFWNNQISHQQMKEMAGWYGVVVDTVIVHQHHF